MWQRNISISDVMLKDEVAPGNKSLEHLDDKRRSHGQSYPEAWRMARVYI